MKLSRHKIIKRLLLASLMATTLTWQGGIVYADADFEHPDNPSNNTITVNADNYVLNGTTINYSGLFGLGGIYLYGGYALSGDVSGNTFTFNGGNIYGTGIFGGSSNSGNVFNNVLNFNGGTFSSPYTIVNVIFGGYSEDGNVTGNIVNIGSGVTFPNTGLPNTGLPNDSFGGPVIFGGQAINGNAEGNIVNINGGNMRSVMGGFGGNGDANNNTVNISGGEIKGNVMGGQGDKNSNNNFINIWGNPNLSSAYLIGYNNATTHSGNTLNLATQITAQNIYAFDNINFFIPKSMNSGGTMLTLTDTGGTNLSGMAIRAAMQGGSNLDTGDTVTLIQSAGPITTDASTTYGKMSQAEYDAIKDRLPSGMLSEGVSLNYEMTIEKSGDNAIVARIGNTIDETATEAATDSTAESSSATDSSSSSGANGSSSSSSGSSGASSSSGVNNSTGSSSGSIGGSSNRSTKSVPSGKLLPQTSVIANSAVVPTLNLASFMNDKIIDWIPSNNFDFDDADTDSNSDNNIDSNTDSNNNIDSNGGIEDSPADDDLKISDTSIKGSKGYEFFMGAGGGSFRNKSGGGAYVDSNIKGFDAGFGRVIGYDNGDLAFAPVFEYATGDYDSYLSDGMHGKGSTKYIAGGLIGRKTFKNGFYIEASARGGKTERDFSSYMTSNGSPVFVHYSKTSAPIFNGHLRVGRQMRINRNNLIDVYGIYFHAHQGSMNMTLSTGEDYHFSSANASKIRLGYRLTTRTSKISRIYTGLAFQYERTSDAVGTFKGRTTPTAGNHGASGMFEFGWLIKPNKNNAWMLDLNATGFVGHQRGLSGTVKLQKEF